MIYFLANKKDSFLTPVALQSSLISLIVLSRRLCGYIDRRQ